MPTGRQTDWQNRLTHTHNHRHRHSVWMSKVGRLAEGEERGDRGRETAGGM